MKILVSGLIAGILLPSQVFAATMNFPNDDSLNQQRWYYDMTRVSEAWSIQTGSSNVVVAVIDDGIDMQHPDLRDNIWVNTREIPSNGIDDDHNGYVDDVYGWDFSTLDYGPIQNINYFSGRLIESVYNDYINGVLQSITFSDFVDRVYENHATGVASLIGATGNNHIDLSGVMWKVKLMNLPVSDLWVKGQGSITLTPESSANLPTEVARAIRYAADNGANVINISSTLGPYYLPDVESALKYAYDKGVVTVVAAGNDGFNLDGTTNYAYPACSRYVLTVGAVQTTSYPPALAPRAYFSNYGPCVDLAAPGEGIVVSQTQGLAVLKHGLTVNAQGQVIETFDTTFQSGLSLPIAYASGTSFSAPIVAGIAGLLKAQNPFATPDQIYERLKATAVPLQVAKGLGAGIVDAYAALTAGPLGPQLQDGSLIQATNDTNIYVIEGGQRRLIPDVGTFNARHYVLGNVQKVDQTVLAGVPLGSTLIPEGGLVRAAGDIDIYIVKYLGTKAFKRLVLSPSVFNSYGHLRWDAVMTVTPSVFSSFTTSDLVRAVGDDHVWRLEPQGDTGERHWISSAEAFSRLQLDAESIYEINAVDRDSYIEHEKIL